jgi:WD40 repeat protein
MEKLINNAENANSMLYVNFNQDGSCFAIGTQTGFMILNSIPFKNNFCRDMNGGIGIIEMLNRSNIVALIGGGKSPRYSSNKLVLWDDHKQKEISEMRFMSSVKNVKMKRDRIFVVTEDKIYIFNFNTLEILQSLETKNNTKGIISISLNENNIIAYPGKEIGSVQIKDLDNKQYDRIIKAHKGPINFLQLNKDGTILATASDKGTLVRLFDTSTGNTLQELRRGTENAEIYSIAFDNTNRFLAVSSDRKTVHIFIINKEKEIQQEQNEKEENSVSNKKSMFGNFANYFGFGKKYFNSEWSFAQFKVNSTKSICTFGPDNSIIVVSNEGKYYQATFDPKVGGECKKIQEKNIF